MLLDSITLTHSFFCLCPHSHESIHHERSKNKLHTHSCWQNVSYLTAQRLLLFSVRCLLCSSFSVVKLLQTDTIKLQIAWNVYKCTIYFAVDNKMSMPFLLKLKISLENRLRFVSFTIVMIKNTGTIRGGGRLFARTIFHHLSIVKWTRT